MTRDRARRAFQTEGWRWGPRLLWRIKPASPPLSSQITNGRRRGQSADCAACVQFAPRFEMVTLQRVVESAIPLRQEHCQPTAPKVEAQDQGQQPLARPSILGESVRAEEGPDPAECPARMGTRWRQRHGGLGAFGSTPISGLSPAGFPAQPRSSVTDPCVPQHRARARSPPPRDRRLVGKPG